MYMYLFIYTRVRDGYYDNVDDYVENAVCWSYLITRVAPGFDAFLGSLLRCLDALPDVLRDLLHMSLFHDTHRVGWSVRYFDFNVWPIFVI